MRKLMALVVACTFLVLGALDVAGQQGLGDIPKKAELPGLIKQLKAKDAKARAKAATLLGNYGALQVRPVAPAVPDLVELVKSDTDATVRREAAAALGKIGTTPKAIVPVLIQALKADKDIGVKTAAAVSLGNMGPAGKASLPALRQVMEVAKKADRKDRAMRNLGRAARDTMRTLQNR